jgi:DNA-binding MarR family transcriptional regulator
MMASGLFYPVSVRTTSSMTLDDDETQTATQAPAQTQLHIPQRMRRAFLSVARFGDTLFNPYGITTDQYSLLLSVYRDPGIRQADIGNAMFAEPNTITAMVTLLEKRGLLRRKPSPTDGRARLVYLTARGETLTQKLANESKYLRKLLYDCFAGAEGEAALKILDRVSEEMQRARETLLVHSGDPESDEFAGFYRSKEKRAKERANVGVSYAARE